MTRSEVLPPEQQALLPHLQPLKASGFTLYGGTAIALQLGHRMSVDFDFFNDLLRTEEQVADALPRLDLTEVVERGDRSWTVLAKGPSHARPLKLSFFVGLRIGRVGQPIMTKDGTLRLAALDDLLGHKLKVIQQRAEAKAYIDIAAMLRAGQKLGGGLGAAQAMFPSFAASEAVRALTWYGDGDLAKVTPADRALLVKAASLAGEAPPLAVISRSLS